MLFFFHAKYSQTMSTNHSEVRIDPHPHDIPIQQQQSSFSSSTSNSKNEKESPGDKSKKDGKEKGNIKLPKNMEWIPNNWTWPKIKPAIRCAVAAWLSCVLFLIPAVIAYMGQVCVLVCLFHSIVS